MMPYIPELSGDKIFWEIVKKKDLVIPCLIDLLEDTTVIKANVPNIGGNYTVSDVSLLALSNIVLCLPYTDIIKNEIGYTDKLNGGYTYWNYVRESQENRLKLKKLIKQWFLENESNLVWKDDTTNYRASSKWQYLDNKHPSNGYYLLKGGSTCVFMK